MDQSFWLSPVPPDGPFTFVCCCQALGIPETRHVIERADLATASTRAVTLWPWQPVDHDAGPPPEPRLPTGGWFGRAARRHRQGRTDDPDPSPG